VTALDAEIIKKQGFIDQIKKDRELIEERLEKIQSPFGTLPVGLSEAVLVFPVVLAAGIILYSLALANMIRLRKHYHEATISRYPREDQKIEGNITILAPVWLDPIGDRSANIWYMLILSLPVLAYIAALLLIPCSWLLGQPQPHSMWLTRIGYSVLYVLSVFFVMLGSLQIRREWWDYKKWSDYQRTINENGVD
jgi:hypothetical protein